VAFVAFIAVTAAAEQTNEGGEKIDLFKKAAMTAVSFKR
jgi:hypothetical protein